MQAGDYDSLQLSENKSVTRKLEEVGEGKVLFSARGAGCFKNEGVLVQVVILLTPVSMWVMNLEGRVLLHVLYLEFLQLIRYATPPIVGVVHESWGKEKMYLMQCVNIQLAAEVLMANLPIDLPFDVRKSLKDDNIILKLGNVRGSREISKHSYTSEMEKVMPKMQMDMIPLSPTKSENKLDEAFMSPRSERNVVNTSLVQNSSFEKGIFHEFPLDPRTGLMILPMPADVEGLYPDLDKGVIHYWEKVRKVSHKGKELERLLVITDQCVYLCDKSRGSKGVTRCIHVTKISLILASKNKPGGFMALKVKDENYDSVFHSNDHNTICNTLQTIARETFHFTLPVDSWEMDVLRKKSVSMGQLRADGEVLSLVKPAVYKIETQCPTSPAVLEAAARGSRMTDFSAMSSVSPTASEDRSPSVSPSVRLPEAALHITPPTPKAPDETAADVRKAASEVLEYIAVLASRQDMTMDKVQIIAKEYCNVFKNRSLRELQKACSNFEASMAHIHIPYCESEMGSERESMQDEEENQLGGRQASDLASDVPPDDEPGEYETPDSCPPTEGTRSGPIEQPLVQRTPVECNVSLGSRLVELSGLSSQQELYDLGGRINAMTRLTPRATPKVTPRRAVDLPSLMPVANIMDDIPENESSVAPSEPPPEEVMPETEYVDNSSQTVAEEKPALRDQWCQYEECENEAATESIDNREPCESLSDAQVTNPSLLGSPVTMESPVLGSPAQSPVSVGSPGSLGLSECECYGKVSVAWGVCATWHQRLLAYRRNMLCYHSGQTKKLSVLFKNTDIVSLDMHAVLPPGASCPPGNTRVPCLLKVVCRSQRTFLFAFANPAERHLWYSALSGNASHGSPPR